MSRFFGRHLAFDLAATLLVVVLTVSIADIDDYGVHAGAIRASARTSTAPNLAPGVSSATADSGSDSAHVCSCLLCIMTISDSFGPRMRPPSPGKLSKTAVAGIAGSPHLSEIYHPPSA